MNTTAMQRALQTDIIASLGVAPDFDAAREAQRRIDFLAEYLDRSGASGYVLGISGGVDSTVAGRLAQLACERRGRRSLPCGFPTAPRATRTMPWPGRHLGAPVVLIEKVPTADLEDDRPQLPDDAAYGVTYAEIDAYLTGAGSVRRLKRRSNWPTLPPRTSAPCPSPADGFSAESAQRQLSFPRAVVPGTA